jgi:HAL2 family 3'(2'),5'-bisphosphate nucleotidase
MQAAKQAVRCAASLASRIQAGVTSVVKADASPVTVGDLASQAAVSLILVRELHGIAAVSTLLNGGGAPSAFRLLGEEDVSALAGNDATSTGLLEKVVSAMSFGLPPRHVFLGGSNAADAKNTQPWSGTDVLAAISACNCTGGLASEGEAIGIHPQGYWVLDPIDGTKGFLRGGQWAVGLAFVTRGVPVLSAIAAPALPRGAWSSGGGGGGVGVLFSATLGKGSVSEALIAGEDESTLTLLTGGRRVTHSELVLCESFEAAHTDRSLSVCISTALGMGATPPIQIDSMVKYGLLVRGCGDIYVRLPQKGYKEKVWDHAPGALLITEAGGKITDARGRDLDFSRGSTLENNEGIIAAMDPKVHAIAVSAAAERMGK